MKMHSYDVYKHQKNFMYKKWKTIRAKNKLDAHRIVWRKFHGHTYIVKKGGDFEYAGDKSVHLTWRDL